MSNIPSQHSYSHVMFEQAHLIPKKVPQLILFECERYPPRQSSSHWNILAWNSTELMIWN